MTLRKPLNFSPYAVICPLCEAGKTAVGGPQRVLERWRCAVSAGPEGWVNVSLEKWVGRKGVGEERGFQAEPLNRKE